MRLINTKTLELVEFFGKNIPEYAILSHTWGKDEVTFKDWKRLDAAKSKTGFSKIEMACRQALNDDLNYLWVDTNCIDKRSSVDLSEAINSMFSWYKNAAICYAYLADVESRPSATIPKEYWEQFRQSRWFTRGWTLQELLAPDNMVFYAKDWSEIATRFILADKISTATGIPREYLRDKRTTLARASIAQRMSWLSGRETTRIEDMAYCMLGIFDINMPLLYGEGTKAFTRLQEEIIRTSTDHTIFCWTWSEVTPGWTSLLAPRPQAFRNSGGYVRAKNFPFDSKAFTMTNAGLKINLPILQALRYRFGVLNATHINHIDSDKLACVPIRETTDAWRSGARDVMQRHPFPPNPLFVHHSWAVCQRPMYVKSEPTIPLNTPWTRRHSGYSFLLLFDEIHLVPDSSKGATRKPVLVDDPIYPVRFSFTVNPAQEVQIGVFPKEKFKSITGLVTMGDNCRFDGVFIKLRDREESVILLGADFSLYPYPKALQRFRGVIPQSELAVHREPELLESMLKCMEKRVEMRGEKDAEACLGILVEKVAEKEAELSWTKSKDKVADSTASGISLEFGEEVECDDGYLTTVLIRMNRSPALNSD